jgi:hypothetical protein
MHLAVPSSLAMEKVVMSKKFVLLILSAGLASAGCSDGSTIGSTTSGDHEKLDRCESMRTYTAALGEATIRCLGTFDTNTYYVDAAGALRANFSSCTRANAREALRDIDDLLALQALEAELPQARDCFAGAYQTWVDDFRAQGNYQCPTFSVVSSRGTPTVEAVTELAHRYDFAGMLTGTVTPPPVTEFHQDFVYDVALPEADTEQPCGDALACATSCGRAFPGWHVGTEDGRFVGDPSWWVADEYGPGRTPYLYPLMYHPMSFYGPLPGDIYGHRNRVGEACSKWAGGFSHYLLTLKLFCLNPAAAIGCFSKCTP